MGRAPLFAGACCTWLAAIAWDRKFTSIVHRPSEPQPHQAEVYCLNWRCRAPAWQGPWGVGLSTKPILPGSATGMPWSPTSQAGRADLVSNGRPPPQCPVPCFALIGWGWSIISRPDCSWVDKSILDLNAHSRPLAVRFFSLAPGAWAACMMPPSAPVLFAPPPREAYGAFSPIRRRPATCFSWVAPHVIWLSYLLLFTQVRSGRGGLQTRSARPRLPIGTIMVSTRSSPGAVIIHPPSSSAKPKKICGGA